MNIREYAKYDATDLAELVKKKQVSPKELALTAAKAIAKANPEIKSVVEIYDDRIDGLDEKSLGKGPFRGVPLLIKDVFGHEKGRRIEFGSRLCEGMVGETDSNLAILLRKAGVNIIGRSAAPEYSMAGTTEGLLYGNTSNPWKKGFSTGGSSGGAQASVTSGMVPIAHGSDIGGSIRIPAFCNGVFGHKPSLGLLPSTGSYPPVDAGTRAMFTHGPLARRAEDLMPLLRILAGPDGVDPLVGPFRPDDLGDPAGVSLRGMPVLLIDEGWPLAVSDDLLRAREQAAGALAAAGARVHRRRMPELRRAAESYVTTLARGSGVAARDVLVAAGAAEIHWREMLRRGGPHTVATRILLVAERAQARVPRWWANRLIGIGRTIAAELTDAIGDGILLEPPLATTAPRHGRTVGRPWWLSHVVPFNLAGLPVTQAPLGLDARGLPLGVQVVAGAGRDHVAIAAALELERVFGGWTPPARYARIAEPVAG
jgi:Asp-tRNA(Asn)/Glu-tRNA(Gln) amidotransferase A subunit family amidase